MNGRFLINNLILSNLKWPLLTIFWPFLQIYISL
jgi:hypothetical protein